MTEGSTGANLVNRRLLGGGLVLLALGGIACVAGGLATTAAVVSAARGRMQQWDELPSAKVQRHYSQVRSAATAGAQGWRQNGVQRASSPH